MPPRKKLPKAIELNPEQTQACNAGSGVWCVAATAGSGKTSVLCSRYSRLVSEGVEPSQILALTFTANAAKNMRDRIGDVQKMDGRASGFVTFHSLCLSICTQEREEFDFKLADFPLAVNAGKLMSDVSRKYDVNFKQLGAWISLQKRSGVRPKQAIKTAETEGKNEKLAMAYKAYDQSLREGMVLDFDSMLLETVTLLKAKPEVLARWSFGWLMCDECQDCDLQQYELLKLLSAQSGNLFMVGDFSQSIYGFRGSDCEIFINIERLFPSVQKLYMTKNHRSTKKIVDFLKTVNPFEEFAAKFYTDNELGVEPVITRYPSTSDEAQAVVEYVRANPKTNVACLTRTNRALRPLEDALSVAGIRYRLLSNSGFWVQPEVKTVIAYMQCILFPADHALNTILRSGFSPTKYMKRKAVQEYIKKHHVGDPKPSVWSLLAQFRPENGQVTQFTSFIHGLQRYRDQPPKTALQSLVQSLHMSDVFEEESPDNSPQENIQELIKMSGRFNSIKDFIAFTFKASAASKQGKGIILGTIHASKGLEHNTVFLPSVCEGILPHSKAESLAEERNIWFVACSRAEKELRISYSGIASPFLEPFLKKESELIEEVFA